MMDAMWNRTVLQNDIKAQEVRVRVFIREEPSGGMVELHEQHKSVASRLGPLDPTPSLQVLETPGFARSVEILRERVLFLDDRR